MYCGGACYLEENCSLRVKQSSCASLSMYQPGLNIVLLSHGEDPTASQSVCLNSLGQCLGTHFYLGIIGVQRNVSTYLAGMARASWDRPHSKLIPSQMTHDPLSRKKKPSISFLLYTILFPNSWKCRLLNICDWWYPIEWKVKKMPENKPSYIIPLMFFPQMYMQAHRWDYRSLFHQW